MNPVPRSGGRSPFIPELTHRWPSTSGDTNWSAIEGSMVLADVSGFTSMSERLARKGAIGAEEITDIIGETFGRVLGEAHDLGGDLLKFGGDAVLLFFEGAEHAKRAALASLGMRSALKVSGSHVTSAGTVTLKMSIGAHTGVFRFFLVGDSHRELIVAGPATTTTVMMESAAKAGQILLSPEMADALPVSFRGRPVGPGVLLRSRDESTETADKPETIEGSDEVFFPKALRQLLSDRTPVPEHRPATVAFIQFLQFDQFLAEEGLAAGAAALDDLVGRVQRSLDDKGLCFLASDVAGDGGKLILTGGVPRATGNDEELMLLALREITNDAGALSIRAGVHRGQVFSGAVGPEFRRTYTVMGDTVNLAARLMAKAAPGQILASETVLEGSRTLFEADALAPFVVKGKRQPVTAFSVGEAVGSRSSITQVGLPLIGRPKELKTLSQAWESAGRGEGRLVEVAGDPGMGKSRLVAEFLGRVDAETVFRTECRLYESGIPYYPMGALLRNLLGLAGQTQAELVEGLRTLVHEVVPDLTPWMSLIGLPMGIEIPESGEVQQLDSEFRRNRLQEAVCSLLAAAVTRPTVVALDDAQWMDEASANLLEALGGIVAEHPWMIVVSRRTDGNGFVAPDHLDGVSRLQLGLLDIEDAIELIDAATADRLLPPNQVRDLALRSQGNPLFLIEMLDALSRGEDVAALPRSVGGLIAARIDHLPADDLDNLRHLSVLGAGFMVEHALVVLDNCNFQRVVPTLERLVEYLTVKEGRVQFRNSLIRDNAYQGLPYRLRLELHSRVADSILREAGNDAEDTSELLSLHFFEAQRWHEAWTYSRISGDRARDAYANGEAERFYGRAMAAAKRHTQIEMSEQVGVLADQAEVAEQAGLYDRSLSALRDAIRLTRADPVAQAELRHSRARAHARTGAYRQALSETARALNQVAGFEGVEVVQTRARLLALRGAIRMQQGRPTEALNCGLEAVKAATESDERNALARAYQVLDGANELLGRHDEVVYADEALAIYEALGDLQGCAHVANDLGVADFYGGRWDQAIASYGRARDMFLKAGNETQAAMAAANMGEVLIGQRRLEEAEPLLREAVRLLRAHNHLDLALYAESQLGRLQIKADDLDGGVRLLTDLYNESTAAGRWPIVLQAAVYLAQGLTAQDHPELALELLDRTKSAAAEDLEVFASAIARARAEVLTALGRREEAMAQLQFGLAGARDQGLLYDEAQLLLLQAELEGSKGIADPELLDQAQGLLKQLGVRAVVGV